jgi:flagellar biosynthesis/type III secretory pathway protein FliH
MSNVVIFPKQKKDAPPTTIEEIYENVAEARKEHIEILLDDVLAFAFQRCYEEGFNLGNDDCLKSTALLVESFRAGLYNTVGIPHPLHTAAETMFIEETDENDSGESTQES